MAKEASLFWLVSEPEEPGALCRQPEFERHGTLFASGEHNPAISWAGAKVEGGRGSLLWAGRWDVVNSSGLRVGGAPWGGVEGGLDAEDKFGTGGSAPLVTKGDVETV